MQHSILVVDDEKDIVDSIERQFRKQYKIFKANSGLEALKILQRESVHLILSDQRMPEMTGVQLFERAQKIQPDAIRILLTGYTDVESVIAAINTGHIYRYITKPWDPQDLDLNIRKALETHDLRADLKDKNAKLEAAIEELKSLDQAKSHFMILIGHELKTPLTTISSFLDLLREENLGANPMKYVQRVAQGVDRLNEIVFDVLDILGAETGQMKVKKGMHAVTDFTSPVIAEFVEQISRKALKLEVSTDKPKAYFDSALIAKVFRKILHNALKFAPNESSIEIKFEEEDENIDIVVSNSGVPIPQAKIDQVLKPFTLDEDIMHHSQGLGLGLSVSQSLLKRHGSHLIIESTAKKTKVGFSLSKTPDE